jgi:hypothetical protein
MTHALRAAEQKSAPLPGLHSIVRRFLNFAKYPRTHADPSAPTRRAAPYKSQLGPRECKNNTTKIYISTLTGCCVQPAPIAFPRTHQTPKDFWHLANWIFVALHPQKHSGIFFPLVRFVRSAPGWTQINFSTACNQRFRKDEKCMRARFFPLCVLSNVVARVFSFLEQSRRFGFAYVLCMLLRERIRVGVRRLIIFRGLNWAGISSK